MGRRPFAKVCLALILLLGLGVRLAAGIPPAVQLPKEGEYLTLTGRVSQKEEVKREDGDRRILILALQGENRNVICYLKEGQELPKMGSTVSVKGRVRLFEAATNPGQFDAAAYYQIQKISYSVNQTEILAKSANYYPLKELLYQFRKYGGKMLEEALPGKEASLLRTMLLGEKKAADPDTKALYQRNGVAHVLCISGLHVSLLGMSLYRLLKKLGAPVGIRTGLPSVVLFLYGMMTGFSVSTIRAVLMFVLQMGAVLCRRTYDLVTAALLAAVGILLVNPRQIGGSSFLFTFGCVLAIGLLGPALTKKRLKGEKEPKGMWKKLLEGLVLTLSLLPLQLWYFYQVPVYSVFLNLLIIPLMSLLAPCGLLLMVLPAGLLSKRCCVLLVMGILSVYEKACLWCEKLPLAQLCCGQPGLGKVVLYLGILCLILLLERRLSLRKKWLLLLTGGALLLWPAKAGFALTFLNVGQGDCIHIESPLGLHYLIDGGSSDVSSVGTYRILPYLKAKGATELEAIMITHPDADHCNGIREIFETMDENGIRIGRLCLPDIGEEARDEAYEELVTMAKEGGVPVTYLSAGQVLQEGEMRLTCFHPKQGYETEDANAYSLVLLLQYRDFRALLTGDVEGEGEELLYEELLAAASRPVTVLKAAHHGSRNSTPEKLLALLSPSVTVISCGEDNSYGHPHQELLKRLTEQETEIYITYETGALTFFEDGRSEAFLK